MTCISPLFKLILLLPLCFLLVLPVLLFIQIYKNFIVPHSSIPFAFTTPNFSEIPRPWYRRTLLHFLSFAHQSSFVCCCSEPLGMRRRLESSSGCGGGRTRLGVPSGAASAAVRSSSHRLSRAGSVRVMSPAQMASSPFAELKVPTTTRPMVRMS